MKAVILAGGLGTRLSEETSLKPKPMVQIEETYSMAYNENLFLLWSKRFHHLLWI